MEMLLDRIFLGYDGKSSGLQAILEPLGWTQQFMKNRPVISHVCRVFVFFVLRLFTKIPWIHTSPQIFEEFWRCEETTFFGDDV